MPRRIRPAAALVGLGLALGLLLGTVSPAGGEPRTHSPYHALTTFAKVLAHVRASYVDDADENVLVYGAIRGLVRSLDPHSAFMTPEEFRVLRSDTEGRFGGIGCEVDVRSGVLTVMMPLDGSPAAAAGLRPGDRILEIAGEATEGMSLQDAVVAMRGEPGTTVHLLVRRRTEDEPVEMTLTRAVIHVESVEARLLDGTAPVGYAKLRTFQEDTADRLHEELDRLEREAGGPLAGLVLDLRSNPGGLVDQAVEVVDEFLEEGVIVTTRGRGGRLLAEERARRRGTRPRMVMAVLVDGHSASASEIVVGALQDHGLATIMGEQTYGKGSVQNVIELPDGSGLKLTVARYHTPSGRCIHGLGIAPDVHLDPAPEREPGASGPDPQIEAARDFVRAALARGAGTPARAAGGRR